VEKTAERVRPQGYGTENLLERLNSSIMAGISSGGEFLMPRTNPPTGVDAALARVRAAAQKWLTESKTAPAAWGRTYVEPDKNIYVTLDKKETLVSKWKGAASLDDRFHNAGSFSADVTAQVDLKLQLEEAWGTWKAKTSPFVYHIPIDSYRSPEIIAAEKKAKEDKESAAKQKAEREQKEKDAKELADKKAKDAADAKKAEDRKKQAMATDWNKVKPPPKDKAKWEKEWLEKNKSRKF
jgi:hypothetical protein